MLRGVRLPYVPGDVPPSSAGNPGRGCGRYPGAGIWPAVGKDKVEEGQLDGEGVTACEQDPRDLGVYSSSAVGCNSLPLRASVSPVPCVAPQIPCREMSREKWHGWGQEHG